MLDTIKIETLYREAESGKISDKLEWLSFVRTYTEIILWGASFLGKSVGQYLLEQQISVKEYWDIRFSEIESVNGITVKEPFSTEPNNKQLVILCIGNTAIRGELLRRLYQKGYQNIIRGDKFFMGLICPYDVDAGIDGLVCNGSMNCRSMFCQRLQNIVKIRNDKGGLFLDNLTFMITTHCSLKCKYCVAYMNSYPKERRKHIPLQQIEEDIDRMFDAVDAIGSITIQGGEPFLHPDIGKIVEKILSKRNLGIVSIATNGIFKISEEALEAFRDNRLNVAFSGYYDALSKEQLDIYYKNIELMRKCQIPHTVGVKVPEWAIPPSLWNKNYTEEIMKMKKDNCIFPDRCMQVMNGKLYPCLYSVSLHGIGLADYCNDYICLNSDNLTDEIRRFIDQPYYMSCGHCNGSQGSTPMAGEQGFFDFVTPSDK